MTGFVGPLAILLGLAVLFGSGWWRSFFRAFAIRPSRMTVRKLGLRVTSPDDVKRVDTVLSNFAGGFNAIISARSESGWRKHCQIVEPLFRPFAEEGAAMGYTLRHLFRYDADAFEREIVKPQPEFRYLHYVGLGFWSGMRNHDATRVMRIADGLDPLHRNLCFDGYGFKQAFFDYREKPEVLRRLDELDGYARNAAYQGVGRALYFLFLGEPETIVEHTKRMGEHAVDVAAGLGLAATFVNPDRLHKARALAEAMPRELQDHFHLGMCFALKARSINDREYLERCVAELDPGVREAVWASIRECDRIELQVRSMDGEVREDGYRQWRHQVTEWLADHIDYPMAGVRTSVRKQTEAQASTSA